MQSQVTALQQDLQSAMMAGMVATHIIAHIEHNQMCKLLYVYSMSQHNVNIPFYTVEPVCCVTVTV